MATGDARRRRIRWRSQYKDASASFFCLFRDIVVSQRLFRVAPLPIQALHKHSFDMPPKKATATPVRGGAAAPPPATPNREPRDAATVSVGAIVGVCMRCVGYLTDRESPLLLSCFSPASLLTWR